MLPYHGSIDRPDEPHAKHLINIIILKKSLSESPDTDPFFKPVALGEETKGENRQPTLLHRQKKRLDISSRFSLHPLLLPSMLKHAPNSNPLSR